MSDCHSNDQGTQTKIAQIIAELHERETGSELSQLFRRMLDATDNTIVISDPNLNDNPLIYVNKEFERLTGYSYAEAVGRNCRFLQGDDREQEALAELRAAVREGRNTRVELRNYRKDGSMFWNEVHLTAVRNDDGDLLYFFGVQNDITRLKELFEAERDLRQALGQRLAFVAVVDMEGRVRRVDASTLNSAALAADEVEGALLADTPWWSHSDASRDSVARCVALARSGEQCRADIGMMLAGGVVMVEVWFTPQRDRASASAPNQIVVTGVDVTERRRAEDLLEDRVNARTKEVRRLASELTLAENRERHRIGQLLHDHVQQEIYAAQFMTTGLRSELAKRDVPPALLEQVDALTAQLRDAVVAARGITSDLSPPVLKTEGFRAALGWIVGRAREQYGVTVELTAVDDVPAPHEALRVLLLSIIRELLFNVVRHARATRARIRALRQADEVCISVEDDGAGFSPGSPTPATPPATGYGLLSIEERLRLFGGRLEVASQPGRGTSVTICVPLASFTLD